jgi:LuxR family maltose regulon positive regulatory protein
VARWLGGLPQEAIMADPPVALVAAWIGGFCGASKQQTEHLLAAVEDATWEGALPDGISSLAFGAALARAVLLFDDVGLSVQAARRALELAGPQSSTDRWMAQAALGHNLYLSGRPAAARSRLEELVRRVSAAAQPYAVLDASAVLSLIASDEDDDGTAVALATRAMAIAETHRLGAELECGIVYLALARTLRRQGRLTEAEEQLGRALALFVVDSMVVQRTHALLLLASVRHGRGDLPGARTVLEQARELIRPLADPGLLPSLLEQTERALGSVPRRQIKVVAPLTERELEVLRLLPTRLSTREIARELYISVNTVKTHVRAIYRKLEVANRAEAAAHARQRDVPPQA